MIDRKREFCLGAGMHKRPSGTRIESVDPTTVKACACNSYGTTSELEMAVFACVKPDVELARKDVFGSGHTVFCLHDENDPKAIANVCDLGLSTCNTSSENAQAMRRPLRTGRDIVPIDVRCTVAPQAASGGSKYSGFGHENGIDRLLASTQSKSVYLHLTPCEVETYS